MPVFNFSQHIHQLEKRKGGYYYLSITADIVEQFEKRRHTRLICRLDSKTKIRCGLNHLGDGNYYIIVSGKVLKSLDRKVGDKIEFEIYEDPDPLGVEVPEVLQVLLDQDIDLRAKYESLTDGKKRSLIYSMNKVKDVDKAVQKTISFLIDGPPPRRGE